MTPQIYILSRKIHRLMVIIIVGLALAMMVTGLNMKYGWFFLKQSLSSEIHNLLSPFFAVVLTVNLLTGLYMYLYTLPRGNNGADKSAT